MAIRKLPRSRRRTARAILSVESLEDRTVLNTYTVTGSIFHDGWDRLDVAIFDANTHPGPDTIVFNMQPDQLRIAGTGGLYAITDDVTIDATTQPGYDGKPLVELDGSQAGPGVSGLVIQGAKVTVRGLAIHNFAADGIVISGGPGGCVIEGNYIGTDVTGTLDRGNGGPGVTIFDSPGNTIGGTSLAARNVISGNERDGVAIVGGLAAGNMVQGNYIGTDWSGMNDLGNTQNGVLITSPVGSAPGTNAAVNNTIGGETAGAHNVISGNDRDGVQIGFGATDNKVRGNLIGTKANGVEALGNTRHGVGIFDSPRNTVGGLIGPTGFPPGNVISGNDRMGVYIGIGANGGGTTDNSVLGNIIGLDETGTAHVPNGESGVRIEAASRNTIGGTTFEARNVISGNGNYGVEIFGSGGSGAVKNKVFGNFIGTDVQGTGVRGNNFGGVLISNVPDNTIGGTTEGARNVISGNLSYGIKVTGKNATGTTIQGNYIGTDYLATAPLGNGSEGVLVENAPGNFIGGTAAGAGNVISANTKNGVVITGSDAKNNRIHGNRIGTDATGLEDLGNKEYGVLLRDKASNNQVGGVDDGAGNTIAFNGSSLGAQGHGVVVKSGTSNAVRHNSIFFNSGRGIDLVNAAAPDTFTLNDPATLKSDSTIKDPPDKDDGANGLQNYPVVVGIQDGFLGRLITWELDSTPKSTFNIDLFANSQPNPSGFGDGERYLYSVAVTTDATGHGTFATLVGTSSEFISATATNNTNSTSEFSLVDTDADGLADAWETRGIDLDEDGVIDLRLGGGSDPMPADPQRKDIFVEVDAMQGLAPAQSDLDRVAAVFASAPVVNPNGTTGITLHARLDETMPRQAWTFNLDGDGNGDGLGGDRNADGVVDPGDTVDANGVLVPGDPDDQGGFPFFKNVKKNGFAGVGGFGTAEERANSVTLAAKQLAFRYAIFADRFAVPRPVDLSARPPLVGGTDVSVSGVGELGGNDFMVTLGAWANTPDQRAGSFMHELGHTLGLNHGGGDTDNFKPNYHSVMNYTWQMPRPWMRVPGGTSWVLDYSTRAFDTLDETNLNENKGIGGHPGHVTIVGPTPFFLAPEFGPVDWSRGDNNGDGTVSNDTGVQADINDDKAFTSLDGYDDWSNLHYGFLDSPFLADGASEVHDFDDMSLDQFEQINTAGSGPGLLEFRLDDSEVSEAAGMANITVTRAAGTQGTVTVDFATVDGSAIAGPDYEATSGTLTFADGEYRKSFTVLVHNDVLGEPLESLTLVLSNPRGGATLGLTSSMTLNILDDDPPTIEVTTTNDDGPGSLRQAIFDANLNPGLDLIAFHVHATGLLTIRPLSALPPITDPVSIDGFDPPGSPGTPRVELDGSLAGAGANGLTLDASSSTIRGLVVNRFSGAGIRVENFSVENHIYGNFIGTDSTGKVALGNSSFGIEIEDSFLNVIGASDPGIQNVISGNAAGGVFIHGSAAFGNTVIGNRIGTQLDGVSPLGNGGPGVLFDGDALLNTVGSDAPGAGNTIAFNAGTGVLIRSGAANIVQMNSIFANAGLGIDLGGDGVTANDPGDRDTGANDRTNYPVLTFAASNGGRTYVTGSLASRPTSAFTLEFYGSAAADGSGFGEGQDFLGSTQVVTDAGGLAAFDVSFARPTAPGSFITATARDPDSNTSEFSAALRVPLPVAVNAPVLTDVASYGSRAFITGSLASTPNASFTLDFYVSAADGSGFGGGQSLLGSTSLVTDAAGRAAFDVGLAHPATPGSFVAATARDVFGNASAFSAALPVSDPAPLILTVNTSDDVDDGVADETHTSLREAIRAANAHRGADIIRFHIPGLNRTISPLSELPVITDPVTIDGTTQPGYRGLPLIELEGSRAGTGVNGLTITGGGSVVRGLVINRFQQDLNRDYSGVGIVVQGFGGNRIEGNFLDTDVTGTNALPNGLVGLLVHNSSDNVIGGTTVQARNVIVRMTLEGFDAATSSILDHANRNRVLGNYIGTDVTGTAFLPVVVSFGNGFDAGILFDAASSNIVGGTEPGAGNLIAGEIRMVVSNNNIVQGNLIGTDVTGTKYLSGILTIDSGNGTHIGGTTAAARNVIAGGRSLLGTSFGSGIQINGGNHNLIRGNYIGTDITGMVALGTGMGVSGMGIFVSYGAFNTIGGTTAGEGNLISGNSGAGVTLDHSEQNVVQGNWIGTDVTHTKALGNGTGVAASGPNLIGGLTSGAGNLISGNGTGLALSPAVLGPGVFGPGPTVQGNLIGTDPSGTRALGNVVGIDTSGSMIGGSEPGAANVISGNHREGVWVFGNGSVVQGNYIGTDATGMARLGNGGDGVHVSSFESSSQNNHIGGVLPGQGNVISANGGAGIAIVQSAAEFYQGHAPTGNLVQGNKIGTDVTGTRNLGNAGDGVAIIASSYLAGDNLIGGTGRGAGLPSASNVIAFNGGHGVYDLFSTGNAIRGNVIFHNGKPGIVVGVNDALASYAEDRSLGLSDSIPALTSAAVDNQGVIVNGSLTGTPFTPYYLDFFSNDAFQPTGVGEGQRLLGSATIQTDASGIASFHQRLRFAASAGQWITATVTDVFGTTSPFARAVPAVAVALSADSVQFTAPAYVVTENGAAAVIMVTRIGSIASTVTVDYATSDGTAVSGRDYAGTSGTLTFNDGETSKTLTIPIQDDAFAEGDESFRIALTNPSGVSLGSLSEAVITIADDDVAGQVQFSSGAYTAREDLDFKAFALLVIRTGSSQGRISVDYRVTGGTAAPLLAPGSTNRDYTDFFGTLTFEDGQTTAEIPVSIVDDNNKPVFEGPETIEVTLGNPTGGATLGSVTTTILTITDEEDRSGSFGFLRATAFGNEHDGLFLTLPVLRRGPADRTTTVDFSTRDGTATADADYEAASGTLTFLPGESQKEVPIRILQDSFLEAPETFQVVLSNPTGGAFLEPGFDVFEATILDNDDDAGYLAGSLALHTKPTSENKDSVEFTVERFNHAKGVVTVDYLTTDGTATAGADYTAVSGRLTFADGEIIKTVRIPILSDSLIEGDETFLVTLSNPTGGATITGPDTNMVLIYDQGDEFQLNARDYKVAENNAGFTVTIELTRIPPSDANPDAPFAVDYTIHDGTARAGVDYMALSGTLTFDGTGLHPFKQTITIPMFNDAVVESDETIILTLSNATQGAVIGELGTATLTILDEDQGNPPNANPDAATTNEDTAVTKNVLANDTDADGDTLSVTANDATSAHGGSVNCTVGGLCTYTPAGDFNGTDTFGYTASDSHGGTAAATVTVTVNPVNDPPKANSDTATTDQDTSVSIIALANDLPGPANESGQVLAIDSVTLPVHGSVAINNNGSPANPADDFIIYTPVRGFAGIDSLNYTICDEGAPRQCDTAQITITVRQSVSTSISGHSLNDRTGNGLTSDDLPLAATKIYLDSNNNGMLDSLEQATTTAADGTYGFTNLSPGTYIVREVVPTGYVRTGPALSDYYTVSVGAGSQITDQDFANFQKCDITRLTNIKYLIDATTTVSNLRGNTREGALVQATFTVTAGPAIQTTLVSYTAPGPAFDAGVAAQQQIFDVATATFQPGTYKLDVLNPNSYFQVDFICGPAIEPFGPAGSNVFYSAQSRLVSADNGGTHARLTNPAGLAGFVYVDANDNGRPDASESGIAQARVTLAGKDDHGASVNLTRLTKSNGSYQFDNLRPSNAAGYRITETQPDGFADGKDTPGTPVVANLAYDSFFGLALTAGINGVHYDFGERPGTGGKITGGGSIDSGVRNFGFVVQSKTQNEVMSFSGNLDFQDKKHDVKLHAAAITVIRVESDEKIASFEGTATVNDVSGYRFRVAVEDNAEPGAGADKFRIIVIGPNAYFYDSNSYASKGGVLDKGGNIQVHKSTSALTTTGSRAADATDSLFDATDNSRPVLVSARQPLTGVLRVSIERPRSMSASQLARIRDAMASWNRTLAKFGVILAETVAGETADVHISLAVSSPCGGAKQGVLGCASDSGEITFINGWSWYSGADPNRIKSRQYDFQTIVAHELGHALGLGHSTDATSVMYAKLEPGKVRRWLAARDLDKEI
jgi:hypothetical protein